MTGDLSSQVRSGCLNALSRRSSTHYKRARAVSNGIQSLAGGLQGRAGRSLELANGVPQDRDGPA
jgi:hypothetical protein